MIPSLRRPFSLSVLAGCAVLFSACDAKVDDTASSTAPSSSASGTTATAAAATATQKEMELRHVDAAGAQSLLSTNKDVVVLDVRTPEEFAEGHITGASNVDFNADDFAAGLARLDRNKTYLVHCASGGRSTRTLPTLQKLGFQSAVHLDGGFTAWQQAGYPVEK